MKALLEPSVILVIAGTCLLGIAASVVGTFSFLQKRSLVGDAVAHAVLPGVCLAFLFAGEKNPWYLLIGATASGWLSLLSIDLITQRSKLRNDAAIAITLSVFFGIGILLLTVIQRSGNAAQSGLDSFLFGKAAAMSRTDIKVFGAFALLLLLIVMALLKEFAVVSFNRDYAVSIGLPVRFFDFVLSTLSVLAIAIGIQSVGVVLMSALLITPAAAAKFWTNRLRRMLVLGALFGMLSGTSGAVISLLAPAMPTGPWIVIVLSFLALVSILFSPGKGYFSIRARKRRNRGKINRENILKLFYKLGESRTDFQRYRHIEELLALKTLPHDKLGTGLAQLARLGWVEHSGQDWRLTDAGYTEARRIVRLHRLWELYLTRRLNLPSDHVHADAESIEHIITPEVEELLIQDLSYPQRDPHQSLIPKT